MVGFCLAIGGSTQQGVGFAYHVFRCESEFLHAADPGAEASKALSAIFQFRNPAGDFIENYLFTKLANFCAQYLSGPRLTTKNAGGAIALNIRMLDVLANTASIAT